MFAIEGSPKKALREREMFSVSGNPPPVKVWHVRQIREEGKRCPDVGKIVWDGPIGAMGNREWLGFEVSPSLGWAVGNSTLR